MRPSLTALFVLAMVSGACSEDERDRAASEGALDEASVAVQCQTMVASFVELTATTPTGSVPEDRASELASAVAKLLNCGRVEASENIATIDLDGLGCAIRGRTLLGRVDIDVSGGSNEAILTFSEVSDGGLTVSGSASASWSGDVRSVSFDGTTALKVDGATIYRVQETHTHTPTSEGIRTTGQRCSAPEAADINCATDEGMAACASSDMDCRNVDSTETTLSWVHAVPYSGQQSVSLMSDGILRSVALSYTKSEEKRVEVAAEVDPVETSDAPSSFEFSVLLP